MDWRRLDLNLLKVLGCMLEERSVARTAERLFITPSAVSHALARLRKAFGDPLFVRSGALMVPTARAAALERSLALFTASLDLQLDPSRANDKAFDPARSARNVRIVAPGALDISVVPRIVAAMREAAPGMTLAVEPFERRSYEADLTGGRVDFVLSVGGHTLAGDTVGAALVREDELVVLVGPKSTLYDGPATIDTAAYLAEPQVYPLPWPVMQNYLDVVLARSGKRRNFSLLLSSYAGLGEVLAATDLIASLPDHTAAVLVRSHPTLRLLRMTPVRRSNLTLLWSQAGQQEPALRWMKSVIETAAAEEQR
jgi:DNA-binding transcriptional LysR family regulator